jgi:uncharacterized protein
MRLLRLSIGCLAFILLAGSEIAPGFAQELGIKVKKPVLGAACKSCPWGALGDLVKEALKPYGYDVQVCYNCWRADAPRIVADASMPPSLANNTDQLPAYLVPPPPNAPVEFGVTGAEFVQGAYNATGRYAGDKPRKNLRLLANIQSPTYIIVAAKSSLGITDLRQIKEKRWPVRVIASAGAGMDILKYYGLTQESIEAAGGKVAGSGGPEGQEMRKNFDVIIHYAMGLANCPEFNVWYEASQKYDLTYLDLPDDLLAKLAKDYGMQRGNIPISLLRGINRVIPTVVSTGTIVYGRVDMPDDFAYTVAKAMDEHQDLLKWGLLPLTYNWRTVAKLGDVPLHPGAARYYKEVNFIK